MNPPTRWIVTGGAGFLGTNLVNRLSATDGEVVVLSRQVPRWPFIHRGVRVIEQDIREVEAYRHELIPGSVVVHLASASYPGKAETAIESDIQDNLLGTIRLAQACADQGVRAFVFLSSGGAVYGNQSASPIREDVSLQPISAYGAMKISIEQYLRIISTLRGLPVALIRAGNPFGEWHDGQRQGAINVFLRKIAQGEPIEVWGSGDQVRDFIPVEDVADAIRAVGINFMAGCEAYNVGSGIGRSLTQVLSDLARVTGGAPVITHLPARAVDVTSNVLDISKIHAEFGWEPRTSYEDALKKAWEWTRRTWPKTA